MKPEEQIPSTIQSVGPATESVREQDKIMLVLSYLGLFALIPMLTVKDSPYVLWHAKNGLVLAGGIFALGILSAVLFFIPCLFPIAMLGWFVVDIMSMVKALNGQRWRLPLISDLAEKL